ncbi:MAG: hypothetical protein ACP5U1_01380 [Desulfomonilaceae bacterium]
MTKSPVNKIIIRLIFFTAFMFVGLDRAEAQVPDFGLGSIVPFKSLQTFFGPLFPPIGLGNTFRSEFGMGMATPMFDRIKLTGTDATNNAPVSLNLLNNNATTPPDLGDAGWEPIIMTQSLDGGPVVYDFFAKFRAWRFAGKVGYMIFDARSRRADGSGFFFDTVTLTGDADLIQGPWLTAGVRTIWYLNQPYFKFNFLNYAINSTQTNQIRQLYFNANPPATIGVYLRYIPPEILGFPMHFDAYADFPLKGSPLQTYGVALVFRPQVYRFDLFTRLKMERSTFNINADVPSPITNSSTSWSLDMLWNLYGAEFGIYF